MYQRSLIIAWVLLRVGSPQRIRVSSLNARKEARCRPTHGGSTASIYQIYPRSFQDSDGDGIGDLPASARGSTTWSRSASTRSGSRRSIPSPMADFGYDVSDYCDIDPLFGTLADFDALLAEAHARGLKLILDFVPNHTLRPAPVVRARAARSRDDPKRDWYLWRDPAPDGGPPNNWLSNFGGPAWTFDAATGQYYYHAFLKEQPDLNWRNPQVRAAMYDVLRFWLRRGVDGFRVDVHLPPDQGRRSSATTRRTRTSSPGGDPAHRLLPRLHRRPARRCSRSSSRCGSVLDEFSDAQSARVLIGELYLPIERLVAYYGARRDGRAAGRAAAVQLPADRRALAGARRSTDVVRDYEAALPRRRGAELGARQPRQAAHRQPRRRSAGARLAAMLLLTLRGTPTLYYGDEIGMTDVPIPPDEVQDPFEKNEPGKGLGPRSAAHADAVGRRAANAGFTTGRRGCASATTGATRNVAAQCWRRTLDAARCTGACSRCAGARPRCTRPLEPSAVHGDLLAYARDHGRQRVWSCC